MDPKLWKKILDQLEPKVSRPQFVTFLQPTSMLEDRGGQVTIGVTGLYAKKWITENILKEITQLLQAEYGTEPEIKFVVVDKKERSPLNELPLLASQPGVEDEPEGSDSTSDPIEELLFNPHYTFETFITGNNNRLAFAAAQVVAEKPGQAYNPLFLYGGVGLGKTHLMQAIGNEIRRHSPKKKIIYTSCETFTSEFITALQHKTIGEFKKKYRTVDVFLVDDIQFLANKEGTQEEFFHTFNILHQSNRQIVVTSDRVPKDIPDMEERLVSRFGWGMLADIQSPNYETRVAILQAKSEEKGLIIPNEVRDYLANAITSNVRELEGSLTKLTTAAKVEGEALTVTFAARILKDILRSDAAHVSSKKIIQVVARYFDIEPADILGRKRTKELVYPRQVAMYLIRELLHHSYPQIGEELGGKDHTTVMHSVDKIETLKKQNEATETDLRTLHQEVVS